MKANEFGWKVRWWWRWFWTSHAYEQKRRARFVHLTGLHGTYVYGKLLADDEIIALQARKIRGLEMALSEQRRGYLKKIARLSRPAAPDAPIPMKDDER